MKTKIKVTTGSSGRTSVTVGLTNGDCSVSRTERISTTNVKGQIAAAHGRAVLTMGSVELAMAEIIEAAS